MWERAAQGASTACRLPAGPIRWGADSAPADPEPADRHTLSSLLGKD